MTVEAEVVWRGAEALRPFLVEIETLEPFPGNPNRGNVEVVRKSLQRFGQVRAIVVDGHRIVAGHTTTEAAREEGWTHIAATPNDFGSEEEARAYLLADNRTAELGAIDDELLEAQLAELRSYEGTGYSDEDRAELEARLALLRNPVFPPSEDAPPALDERSGTSGLFEVPLLLDRDSRKDFARLIQTHKREWGIADVTAIVLRLLRESAARL